MLPYYENRADDFFAFGWNKCYTWAPHLHQQLELLYVEKGAIEVTIDFQTRILQKGDLAVAFPHCIHGYQVPPAHTSLAGQFKGLMAIPALTGEFQHPLSHYLPRTPFVLAHDMQGEAAYAIQQLFSQPYGKRPQVIKAYLQLLLALIWPVLGVESNQSQHIDDTPHRAIRYVVEHYRQPLQAKDVAAALGISQSHLARIFSGRLHMGFNEYVNQLRVHCAQDLLRTTNRPITDILLDVGFESQSTFNRAFREVHGISPREYRQNEQKNPHPQNEYP